MRLLPFLAAAAVVALPVLARADVEASQDAPRDPQVARLLEAKQTLKWNWGKSERYGHAEALVGASVDTVAKTIVDFNHYKELHRKFASARVIAKEGDNTDVYMKYPVQIGPLKIEFYEVMRFGAARANGGTRILEGTGIKGDMSKGHTIITVKPVDATHSLLLVDILLIPKLPAPQSLVDEELRDGAGDFVNGLKDRAQGWVGPVTTL